MVWDLGLSSMGPQRYRDRELSQAMRQRLEICVDDMVDRAHAAARDLLRSHRADLERLAAALLEHEVLYEPELLEVLGRGGE